MTEVFKSEAIHTLSGLIWTVFIVGAMVVMSLLTGFVAYTYDVTLTYVPSILSALLAIMFYFRAKKCYNIINTYIHFPPNCKIVDARSLTSGD